MRESGIGKITFLFFSLILAVVGFCAYNILPFYYYYFEMVNNMQQVIRVASSESDQEIRQKLYYHIKHFEIPVDPEKLKIERDGKHMRISLPYEEVFYITWKGKDYDIHTFKFNAYAEGEY